MRRLTVAWQCRDRVLALGERTLIMGVLNVTPDSFSDGGRHFEPAEAVRRALEIVREGADIIDIGGESSRPGSERISLDEELRRVIPVIEAVVRESNCIVSADTMKAGVARRALEAGAHIINDISALEADADMLGVVAEHRAGVVLMHMRGDPRTMQDNPQYGDVVREVCAYLRERILCAGDRGLPEEHLAVDPGIGFGKTVEHNLQLIAGLPELAALGRPVVAGLSRKSFLGRITGREVGDRLPASLGAMVYAITRGAHIVRVHDVKESCDAARVADILVAGE